MAQFILKNYFILIPTNLLCHASYHEGQCAAEMSTADGRSGQVSDHQEYEDAGQQHSSDHD